MLRKFGIKWCVHTDLTILACFFALSLFLSRTLLGYCASNVERCSGGLDDDVFVSADDDGVLPRVSYDDSFVFSCSVDEVEFLLALRVAY